MLPVQNLLKFIDQYQLFNKNSRVLAAVSGGRDSVVLVHLLNQAGINLGIVHCNFNLRPAEALAEQDFTRKLAAVLNVPFYTTDFDTKGYAKENGISTQMAARDLRYQWFEQIRVSEGYDCIAVAHHQNDSVETILLNLTRGTGIAGMHGILPKNGHVVRPLLFLNRGEIDNIIVRQQLLYMEDSSNASSKYARNKIRLEIVPRLKELNPRIEETFNKNIERFKDLEILLNKRLEQLRAEVFEYQNGDIHIDIAKVKKLEPKKLLLFGLLNPYGFTEQVTADVIASLGKHAGRNFESAGYRLVLDREKLILTKHTTGTNNTMLINEHDNVVGFGSYRLSLLHNTSVLIMKDNLLTVSVDADRLIYPLTIRNWQQADYFYPLGMHGRKKLSDFFVNQKVPLNYKSQIPVLTNGNGDIIWIGGYRLDERYKVTAYTKKVVIFELYKLNL